MKAKKASSPPKAMPDSAVAFSGGSVVIGSHERDIVLDRGNDDDEQSADLDQREDAGQHDGFQDAPCRDAAEQRQHRQHDQILRQRNELLDVAGRAESDGGGGNHPDRDRQQTDRGGEAVGTGTPP